jgi:hypothetical protein
VPPKRKPPTAGENGHRTNDMGLKALPKHSGEYLLEVIMRRYENRSTITYVFQ